MRNLVQAQDRELVKLSLQTQYGRAAKTELHLRKAEVLRERSSTRRGRAWYQRHMHARCYSSHDSGNGRQARVNNCPVRTCSVSGMTRICALLYASDQAHSVQRHGKSPQGMTPPVERPGRQDAPQTMLSVVTLR